MKKGFSILLVVLAAGMAFILTRPKPVMKPPLPDNHAQQPETAAAVPAPPAEDLKDKQIIVFAFDGSKSLDMWRESLDFAQTMKDAGKPIHFTYFISGVYLITYQNKTLYQPPLYPAGTSKVGFGDSKSDVIARINYINRAVNEGHEIGSHLNGHFDGTLWTSENWKQEFSQFDKLFTNVNVNNQIDQQQAKLNISLSDIKGFRAPDLGRNQALWPVLTSHNFVYDTSMVGKLGEWPRKENELWEFAIPSIKFANTNYSLLSMDYNFYIKQTQGKDTLTAGTPAWQTALDEVYQSYVGYFDNNYNSTKAPVFIAHHFSKWNDGVYWAALKKFAEAECGKAEVRCVSYKELVAYLNRK